MPVRTNHKSYKFDKIGEKRRLSPENLTAVPELPQAYLNHQLTYYRSEREDRQQSITAGVLASANSTADLLT